MQRTYIQWQPSWIIFLPTMTVLLQCIIHYSRLSYQSFLVPITLWLFGYKIIHLILVEQSTAFTPWQQASECQRPATGECALVGSCCGQLAGVMDFSRRCMVEGTCLPSALQRTRRCRLRCGGKLMKMPAGRLLPKDFMKHASVSIKITTLSQWVHCYFIF